MGLSGHDFNTMTPAPAASAVVIPLFITEDGVMLCYGTAAFDTVLEATDDTYAPGCIYIYVVAGGSSVIYVNEGTKAVPDFDVVTVA